MEQLPSKGKRKAQADESWPFTSETEATLDPVGKLSTNVASGKAELFGPAMPSYASPALHVTKRVEQVLVKDQLLSS